MVSVNPATMAMSCLFVSCIASFIATTISEEAPLCKEEAGSSEHSTIPGAETKDGHGVDLSELKKFASGNGDALFRFIERSQINGTENASFGSLLDAGTGSHSLSWIASVVHREKLLADSEEDNNARKVHMKDFTAITADESMRRKVSEEATELGVQDSGNIIIGKWNDATLLEGKLYDTILVDYLIGAIDGFTPYFQDQIFDRLAAHLAIGGRLYVAGLQPIPDKIDGDGDVFCRITKVRDACILLAGHRCYREYPLDWIERHLEKAGLSVVQNRQYPIMYGHYSMKRQINLARSKLIHFPTKTLADSMGKVLDDLDKEALEVTSKQPNGKISLGFDYVVVAERTK